MLVSDSFRSNSFWVISNHEKYKSSYSFIGVSVVLVKTIATTSKRSIHTTLVAFVMNFYHLRGISKDARASNIYLKKNNDQLVFYAFVNPCSGNLNNFDIM